MIDATPSEIIRTVEEAAASIYFESKMRGPGYLPIIAMTPSFAKLYVSALHQQSPLQFKIDAMSGKLNPEVCGVRIYLHINSQLPPSMMATIIQQP